MNPISITYDMLVKGGHLFKPVRAGLDNPLYGKEIYVRSVGGRREVLYQSLGYVGAYANNYYDSTIDYVLLSDNTIDGLKLGIKDDDIRWVEQECERQRASYKGKTKWKFRMQFIVEGEVIRFLKDEFDFRNEECGLNLISKYHDE